MKTTNPSTLRVLGGIGVLVLWSGLLYGFSGQDSQEKRIADLEKRMTALEGRLDRVDALEKGIQPLYDPCHLYQQSKADRKRERAMGDGQ